MFEQHCKQHTNIQNWLQREIGSTIKDYKERIAERMYEGNEECRKRGLFDEIAGWFGAGNSVANSWDIYQMSKGQTWIASTVGEGMERLGNGQMYVNEGIRLQGTAIYELMDGTEGALRNLTKAIDCRIFAGDLLKTMKEEIMDIRLRVVPRHAEEELRLRLAMIHPDQTDLLGASLVWPKENGKEPPGHIGFYLSIPYMDPNNQYKDSLKIRPIGVLHNETVIVWEKATWKVQRGNWSGVVHEACCYETNSHVVCRCPAITGINRNISTELEVHPLEGWKKAVQVGKYQWCVLSNHTNFKYGDLTCQTSPGFCFAPTHAVQIGDIYIPEPEAEEFQITAWWDDTYLDSYSVIFSQVHKLVKIALQRAEQKLLKAKVEVDLAQLKATVLKRYGWSGQALGHTFGDYIVLIILLIVIVLILWNSIQCFWWKKQHRQLERTIGRWETVNLLGATMNKK